MKLFKQVGCQCVMEWNNCTVYKAICQVLGEHVVVGGIDVRKIVHNTTVCVHFALAIQGIIQLY